MAHPRFENSTEFPVELLGLADEAGRPVVSIIVKATLTLTPDGQLRPAENQLVLTTDAEHNGADENSSLRFESETAFCKPATDVVFVGHAHAPNPGTQFVDAGLKVGPVQKIARVFGDRFWVKTGGSIIATKAQSFERLPLVYERAFGGWDKADNDESNWRYEPRNPVGMGFGDPLRFVEEGKVPIPNIEDPQHLIARYGDTPPPAGFGFISPNWQPRAQYAGTYDEKWDKERKPLLPADFDRRFFNAASPGLVAPGYLRGDEDVMIVNASPVPKLKFKLPGIPPPVCKFELRGGRTEVLQTNLDTVIINTDEMLVFLLWRNYMQVPNGPHDVVSIEVTTERELHTATTV